MDYTAILTSTDRYNNAVRAGKEIRTSVTDEGIVISIDSEVNIASMCANAHVKPRKFGEPLLPLI